MCLCSRNSAQSKTCAWWVHLYVLPTLVWLKDDGVKKVLVFFDLGLISSEHSCKTKVSHFQYVMKTNGVIKLAWSSKTLFACNELYLFVTKWFVYWMKYFKIYWQSFNLWRKERNYDRLYNFFAKNEFILHSFRILWVQKHVVTILEKKGSLSRNNVISSQNNRIFLTLQCKSFTKLT